MNISEQGLNFIKQFEGFRSKPYADIIGVYTIGYGTTKYPDGRKVQPTDPEITEPQAVQYLQNALQSFVSDLNRLVKGRVAQNQFDALCSLIYNIGTTNFASSTLLKKLNAGDIEGAANEFPKWRKAGGQFSQGLLNRRLKERDLFNA